MRVPKKRKKFEEKNSNRHIKNETEWADVLFLSIDGIIWDNVSANYNIWYQLSQKK